MFSYLLTYLLAYLQILVHKLKPALTHRVNLTSVAGIAKSANTPEHTRGTNIDASTTIATRGCTASLSSYSKYSRQQSQAN